MTEKTKHSVSLQRCASLLLNKFVGNISSQLCINFVARIRRTQFDAQISSDNFVANFVTNFVANIRRKFRRKYSSQISSEIFVGRFVGIRRKIGRTRRAPSPRAPKQGTQEPRPRTGAPGAPTGAPNRSPNRPRNHGQDGVPGVYCLLPSAYCPSPISYCLLLLPVAYCLLLLATCLLHSAYYVLLSAYCLSPGQASQ